MTRVSLPFYEVFIFMLKFRKNKFIVTVTNISEFTVTHKIIGVLAIVMSNMVRNSVNDPYVSIIA